LKVFENGVLRGNLEPKREGVTGIRRKLHNEELDNSSKFEIDGACNTHWKINAYLVLIGKAEGKKLLGRTSRR